MTPAPKVTVAVLGAGKFGAAMALLLARAGHEVRVWARRPAASALLAKAAPAAERMRAAATIEEACAGAALIAFAVPVGALREVARTAGNVTDGGQIALHACRGVDAGFTLAHQVIRQETCLRKIGVLGGPLYFDELTSSPGERGRPLVAVVASRFDELHRVIRAAVAGTRVRVHATYDVVGVEVAGAISNVSHLAAGIAEGLGLGETDQGLLLTHGLVEATRIGRALGAERSTFSGLAGVGDLIPRAVTSVRRHRSLGAEIGGGREAAQAAKAQPDLEGPHTLREARALGQRLGLALPLIEAVDDVLHRGERPAAALERVLSLDLDLDVVA